MKSKPPPMQVGIIRDETVQSICETEFPSDILNKRKITVQTVSVITFVCVWSIKANSKSAACNSVLAIICKVQKTLWHQPFLTKLNLDHCQQDKAPGCVQNLLQPSPSPHLERTFPSERIFWHCSDCSTRGQIPKKETITIVTRIKLQSHSKADDH